MTFLPIVERELRVAARRKATYWTRTGVAAAALLLFGGVVGIFSLPRAGFGAQMGPMLFGVFSWLAFVSVCVAGVLLTSDSVSEEKRDGTLGLLFLTDLRGYDVVLGKLLASSLQAAYGLVAAFPIFGLAFLLGGVTGAEFGRLVLVLCNSLFFSLAIGVYVSTVSREAQRAMTAAALLLIGFTIGLPTVDWALAGWDSTKFVPRLSYLSPSYGFGLVRELRPTGFILNLMLVHAGGWLMLALASFLAPKSWQEKANNLAGASSRAHRWRFGSPALRAKLRHRWLAVNPVRWLAARELWLGRMLWPFCFLLVVVALSIGLGISEPSIAFSLGTTLNYAVLFLFKLWFISQACRFFLETTRTGMLELLLISPLPPDQIVRGQVWALRRRFGLTVVLLLLLQLGMAVLQFQMTTKAMAGANTGATVAGVKTGIPDGFITMQVISGGGAVLTTLTGLFALGWFGMWMGFTSKKINGAILKTLLFVDVIPAVLITFLQGLLMFGLAFAQGPIWFSTVVATVAQLVADLVFMQVARRRLLTRFRELAGRAAGAPVVSKPPPLPPGLVAVTTTTAGS